MTGGILIPQPGIEPIPLHERLGVLNTGTLGKALTFWFLKCVLHIPFTPVTAREARRQELRPPEVEVTCSDLY